MLNDHHSGISSCECILKLFVLVTVDQVLDRGLARAQEEIFGRSSVHELEFKLKIPIGVAKLLPCESYLAIYWVSCILGNIRVKNLEKLRAIIL